MNFCTFRFLLANENAITTLLNCDEMIGFKKSVKKILINISKS